MATIEFIQKRITGKEKEIEKLEKKLARIRKAEATGWEVNPYYYDESDLRYALRDLDAAKKALDGYRADLVTAEEKANSRNIPAILDFLELWKARCTEFYLKGLTEYYSEQAKVRKLYDAYTQARYGTQEYTEAKEAYENAHELFRNKEFGYFKWVEYEWHGRKRQEKVKDRDGEYEYLRPYTNARDLETAKAKLEKDLTDEANRKYDFIVERTNAIVGEITDASELEVGAKGDLNGYITGKRGRAKVQTIGAGGYNIQCFHFRTLINKA